jgi:hypothetical protein
LRLAARTSTRAVAARAGGVEPQRSAGRGLPLRDSRARCPHNIAVRHGQLHSNVTWQLALQRVRGVADTPNYCEDLAVSQTSGPITGVSEKGLCLPVRLVPHGLLISAGGDHSCHPSYSIFIGLVSPEVSRIEVVFRNRDRLRGHLVRISRSAHLPLNVFVAATRANRQETGYLIWTKDDASTLSTYRRGPRHRRATRTRPSVVTRRRDRFIDAAIARFDRPRAPRCSRSSHEGHGRRSAHGAPAAVSG